MTRKKRRWIWIAGFRVLYNSREWRALRRWLKKHRPRRKGLTPREKAVRYCKDSLAFHGRMVYTEGPGRSELFNRVPGAFLGAGADCSQFVSAIMHWCGVQVVNQWDATGTLLGKGRAITTPKPGAIVIFGPGAGVHTGMFVEERGGEWFLVEFGMQEAPDEVSLSASIQYFKARGNPGVRFRDFF